MNFDKNKNNKGSAIKENIFQYSDDVKDLVVARLETLPSGAVISIGSGKELTKNEAIQSVKEGNETGQKMMEIEMSFLQGLKDGILYDEAIAFN